MTDIFKLTAQYFPTPLQQFQYFDKYSRFDYTKMRREAWPETVDRTVNFLCELAPGYAPWLLNEGRQAILTLQALPSMRLIAMAGEAARRQHISIYNCSYLPVDDIQAWVEMLIISMAGCGVGFSVEQEYVSKLPKIQDCTGLVFSHMIEDSSEGWAEALRFGLECWFTGNDVDYDFSQIRLAGKPLKTKGGRASGPEPLRCMLHTIRRIINNRRGGFLRTIDAHDISCAVGEAAVQGGMRRTAMISLSDLDDELMLTAKRGLYPPIRWNANNSAVWPEAGVTDEQIVRHMTEMYVDRNGERGIYSRQAAFNSMPNRRLAKWPKAYRPGVNPCGEIIKRPKGFCNLSIAPAREGDSAEDLVRKVKAAAIFGTIQSTATNFVGLRPEWKINAEEERLLGVDITGQMDCSLFRESKRKGLLEYLKQIAIEQNIESADKLCINRSLAVSCVKPSGNSSTLFDCSPGLHARHSKYYVRNVRVSAHSPVYQVLRDAGAPLSPENDQVAETATTWVCAFPCKSPVNAITKDEVTALDQLELWKDNKLHWTEHNPSITVTYKDEEFRGVVDWVIKNKEIVGGISFLPASDAAYAQMPYMTISEQEYESRIAAFPEIDWSRIADYEDEDQTNAAQELACANGSCLI